MVLPSSGQITLDQIHVEAGGTTQTLATIDDADIRGLLSPTPASGAEQGFDDYYGASAVSLSLQGSTENMSTSAALDTAISSTNPINLTGLSIGVGDLVVFGASARGTMDSSVTWTGMTLSNYMSTTNSLYNAPARLIYIGNWQSGNSNPYISNVMTYDGTRISNCTAVFRDAGSVIQNAVSDQQVTNASSWAISGQNLSSYSGSSTPAGIITVLMIETDNALVNEDAGGTTTITAPSGYTLARATQSWNSKGEKGTCFAIAYKVTTSTAAETIGNWGFGTRWEEYDGLNNYSVASFRVGG